MFTCIASKWAGCAYRLPKIHLAVVLAVLLPITACGFEKTATTAAAFLQIGVGGRIPAMGNAGVAYPGGPDMLATNPAAAGGIGPERGRGSGLGVSVSYIDWFAGLRHQSAMVLVPVSPTLRFGLQLLSFGGDEFEQTTLAAQEGNGIMVDYGDLAVGGSVIAELTDRFTVGVTGKYIRQDLFNTSASTFAFDVGTLLETELDGFNIGMAMTNLGGEMQLDGRDLIDEPGGVSGGETRLATSAWPLPLTFQTGVAWRVIGRENAFRNNELHGIMLVADAKHLNESVTSVHLGAEYGFAESVFLRGGQTLEHDSEKWAFGCGIRVNLYNYALAADFAYADLGDLDSVQRITLTLTDNPLR